MGGSLAQLAFDTLCGFQESVGGEHGVDANDGIDKLVFGLEAPRLGIIKSRLAHYGANLLVYQRNSLAYVFLLVS